MKNGVVTAVSDGTATITAAVGKRSASCKIKVYTPVPLESITLSEQNLNWDITLQDETTLTVTYNPVETTDDKKVTWSSSDENVVRVTGTGVDKETALVVAEGHSSLPNIMLLYMSSVPETEQPEQEEMIKSQ